MNELHIGTGETASLLRTTNWAATPLGPYEHWPQSLRVAVSICLGSRLPMFVWWGRQLINIYNDAYIPVLGKRHPCAFGEPAATTWSEIWDVVGTQAEIVMTSGQATRNERVQLLVERNGHSEEIYSSWSYSPIPDEEGGVGGVFCACIDETRGVLAGRERDSLIACLETKLALLAEAFAQSPAFLAVTCGPEHVIEYASERYLQLVGHRDVVGKPMHEVVNTIHQQRSLDVLDHVYRTGEPAVDTAGRFELEGLPGAGPDVHYLDCVCEPMRSPDGSVRGLLAHGVDITESKLAELRDRFLLTLEESVRALTDPAEIVTTCARLLGEHLEASRCAYADVEQDQNTFDLTGDYTHGVASMVGRYRFSDFGTEVIDCLHRGQPYVCGDIAAAPAGADPSAFPNAQIRAVICVPLHKADRLVGAMAVHQSTVRHWKSREVELVQHVLSHCWEALERSRVTRELLASEERFRAAVNATSSILWTNDSEGKMSGEQPGWEAFTGQKRHEYQGYGWIAALHPDDAQNTLDAWRATVVAQSTFVFEHRVRRADGELRTCAVRAVPVRDGRGVIREWVGVHTDITDQRQFELNLQESETRFRHMSDNAPVMIWMTRAEGHCEYLNARWYAFTGQKEEDTLRHGWLGALHPDDMPRVQRAFLNANATQQPFQVEYRLRRRDGEYRWCVDAASPRSTLDGEFVGYIGSVVDINERKRVQDALASEKKVLELIATGSALRDVLDTLVRSVEAQSSDGLLCSISLDDSAGKLLDSAAHAALPKGGHLSPILASDGRMLGVVATHYQHDHSPSAHDAELSRSATHLAGIVIERHLVDRQLRDSFDAEHRARSLAERTNRMKDEFLASLSHELRTPLTAILGWAQIIKMKPGVTPDLKKATEVIERNARAQVKIIEDLLNMSAIISGKLRLEIQRVDLRSTLMAALDTARPAADAKRIRVDCSFGTAPDSRVNGDPNRLQQILWNLLSNAIKFTPEEGHVRVHAGRVDSRVEVSISDDGEGIPAEFLPFVFDRFRQADASSTRRHGGLGLGLSIVKQLVELHGGSVSAHSAGVGNGSTFVVSLPVASPVMQREPPAKRWSRQTESTDHERHPESTSISGMRVLVVDDEPDARELLRQLLERGDASVVTTDSADQALALVREQSFDVLLSDIGMPGQDGNELMRRIRALGPAQGGDIPAVALTSYAQPEDCKRALDAGYQKHLTKPVDASELINVLASVGEPNEKNAHLE